MPKCEPCDAIFASGLVTQTTYHPVAQTIRIVVQTDVKVCHTTANPVKKNTMKCCSKVIMSGVNGNVIMSGCEDDNPDDERREAVRDYTKSVSGGADGGRGGNGTWESAIGTVTVSRVG